MRDVAKVDLVGVQDEKIYLEFSTQQIAALGIDVNTLVQTLQAQNALVPSGMVDAGPERIAIRVSGGFTSEESLKAVNFRSNNRFFRLSDIATGEARLRRSAAADVPLQRRAGHRHRRLDDHRRRRAGAGPQSSRSAWPWSPPICRWASTCTWSPTSRTSCDEAVGEFTKSLMEAIAIVLAVSFLALGWRPGIVVAIAIPLVLAITFVAMKLTGISLQRISLGALIIALGLLVDDAMIAVEMMITKMEEGYDKVKAATYAYTSTAFPMLTGTLVTIAGFVPVGFAQSGAGEYCFSLFAVVGIALIVSWIVAVLFTPLTGVLHPARQDQGPRRAWQPRASRAGSTAMLDLALRNKGLVLAATAGLFVLSLVGMGFVQQQFFPKSDRPELLVDLTLPQSASIKATQEVVDRVEKLLEGRPRHGPLELLRRPGRHPLLPAARRPARQRLLCPGRGRHQGAQAAPRRAGPAGEGVQRRTSTTLMARVTPLELGPPVGWPLKFRVSGPDPPETRELAQAFAQVLGQNPGTRNINYDWNEPAKVDQGRGRPGSRPRARHHLAAARQQHQCRAVGHPDHAAARCHLSDRHRRARGAGGARASSRRCAT